MSIRIGDKLVSVSAGETLWGNIPGDIDDQIDLLAKFNTKINKNQGVQNAGKVLTVGQNGEATPQIPKCNWGGVDGDINDQTDLAQLFLSIGQQLSTLSTAVSGKSKKDLSDASPTAAFANLLWTVGIDCCVERVVDTDGNGYRLYASGYCEQWGKHQRVGASDIITLTKPYKDANYSVFFQAYHNAVSTDGRPPLCQEKVDTDKTNTQFTINVYTGYKGVYWHTCGYVR